METELRGLMMSSFFWRGLAFTGMGTILDTFGLVTEVDTRGTQGDRGFIRRAFQSTEGLCIANHDNPITTGYMGQETTLYAI